MGAHYSSLRKARVPKALCLVGARRKKVGSRRRPKAPNPYLRRHCWC